MTSDDIELRKVLPLPARPLAGTLSSDKRYYYLVRKTRFGDDYIAMAKLEPFVNGHPIYEPGTLWFEFGRSEGDALKRLKQSLVSSDKQ